MSDYERRAVLKYAGLAVAAGAVTTTGAVTADESADSEDADGAGEPEGWSSVRGDAGNTGYVPATSGPESPSTAAWEYDHGGSFVVVDETVYLIDDGGAVHAIDAAEGSPEWKTEITTEDRETTVEAVGPPAVANDTLYVFTKGSTPDLTALDTTNGDVRWQERDLGNETNQSPIVADELVFVVADKILYALDASTGEKRWVFDPEPATFDDREYGDPLRRTPVAVADDAVFVVSNKRLFALDVETGDEKWTDAVESWASDTFSGHPVAADGVVAIVKSSSVVILDAETGDRLSTISTNSLAALSDTRVYAVVEDDDADADEQASVIGYDTETGDSVWETAERATSYGSVVVDAATVYAAVEGADGETGVSAFDHEGGDHRWSVDTDAKPQQIAVVGETVYASGDTLVAIRSETDTEDEATAEDDTDGTAGFTTGAAVAGGALSLEWLRRRAASEERN